MSKHEAIEAVIRAYGLDPDTVVETENGKRTIFEVVEAGIMAALDEIE